MDYHVEVAVSHKQARDLSIGRLTPSRTKPGKWALDLYGTGMGFAGEAAAQEALAQFREQWGDHNEIKGTVFQYESEGK